MSDENIALVRLEGRMESVERRSEINERELRAIRSDIEATKDAQQSILISMERQVTVLENTVKALSVHEKIDEQAHADITTLKEHFARLDTRVKILMIGLTTGGSLILAGLTKLIFFTGGAS